MNSTAERSLRVIQVLPALNAGGVERGTVEFARELVKAGHESLVISSGGRQLSLLEAQGSRHITLPVQRKSLWSLRQVRPMQRLLTALQADIVHVRSRLPAWIVWLAWRRMPRASRPRLVSTFHGMYSVNFYSAIMARAEHCIAVSESVRRYVLAHYSLPPERLSLIPRGVDPSAFSTDAATPAWCRALYAQYPAMQGKKIILMPGRLSRWKGQEAFLTMMSHLQQRRSDCHGVVVGDAEPDKQHYLQELLAMRGKLDLDDMVSFVGHRNDIAEFYALAAVTCHLSSKAEPFGRTVPESLAAGTPVVAFDRGGAGESLAAAFPQGLVPLDDLAGFAARVDALIDSDHAIALPSEYYLSSQVASTLAVYRRLLQDDGGGEMS